MAFKRLLSNEQLERLTFICQNLSGIPLLDKALVRGLNMALWMVGKGINWVVSRAEKRAIKGSLSAEQDYLRWQKYSQRSHWLAIVSTLAGIVTSVSCGSQDKTTALTYAIGALLTGPIGICLISYIKSQKYRAWSDLVEQRLSSQQQGCTIIYQDFRR